MNYPPGYFSEPVRAWFGPHWKPSVDWRAPKQRATRTSANGDNFNIISGWSKTKKAKP